jgi:hypothetical protein
LSIDQADAHTLRGLILVSRAPEEAEREYQRSFTIFAGLAENSALLRVSEFHWRLGDLLLNLAALSKARPGAQSAHRLLEQAAELYAVLANKVLASGTPADAQNALDTVYRLLPELPPGDRNGLVASYGELERKLQSMTARK